MLEDSIKKQILCIIAEASMQDGWAKQAVVCSKCLKQGIDLKIYGGAKNVFSQLSEYIEISSDTHRLPILKLREDSLVKDSSNPTNVQFEAKAEKKGLCRLGYVHNLPKKDKPFSCLDALLMLVDNQNITLQEINTYIESDDFKIEYFDSNKNQISNENEAVIKRFILPFKDKYNGNIYGEFSRKKATDNFLGVFWYSTSIISLKKYGEINPQSINDLRYISQNESITESNIFNYVISDVEYLNGAGYAKFTNGGQVSQESGKFARFKTCLRTKSGNAIFIWFTKNSKGSYEGLNCGDENTFKQSLSDRQSYFSGRMSFESIELCNNFYKELAKDSMKEPWEYKNRKDNNFDCPILKAYLEYELERLFYEYEELHKENKIVFNKTRDKILFNTNLLDKFAHDLIIVGDIVVIGGKTYIKNLQKNPTLRNLKQLGFINTEPLPPEFFNDINEIVFHCNWDIDRNIDKYTHIIEQRLERFPDKYKSLDKSALSNKLDNAIEFAQKIAQRNYKFIVPMYYPKFHRIQLLMPIYLENSSTYQPDFALVLTPDPNLNLYTPETILGLEEVYQDARLIAKPDESWLNPEIIK